MFNVPTTEKEIKGREPNKSPGSDGYVHRFDCSDGITGVGRYSNSSKCTH